MTEWLTRSSSYGYMWPARIWSSLIICGFTPTLFFACPQEIKRWGLPFCYCLHTHRSVLLVGLSYCVDPVPSVWRIPVIIFFPQCTFVPNTLSVTYMTAYLFRASVWRIYFAGYKALDWLWFHSAFWRTDLLSFDHCFHMSLAKKYYKICHFTLYVSGQCMF